jgi:hypothetical protein
MKRRKGEWICPECGERFPDDLKKLEPKKRKRRKGGD